MARKEIPANVTHYAQLKNSEYLGHWDIPEDKKIKVTLEHLSLEEVVNPASKKKEWKNVFTLKGTEKRFILNATNMKSIASWYGNDPHKWDGKEIELVRALTSLKGETVECIRVTSNDKKRVKDISSAAEAAIV